MFTIILKCRQNQKKADGICKANEIKRPTDLKEIKLIQSNR